EGFERGSTAELLAFLYIARGSAGEVRSMLHFVARLIDADGKSQISDLKSEISNLKSQISNLKSEISSLKSLAESCSRQIRAWANSLQNTDIKGQRHLNDSSRDRYQSKRRADQFKRKLAESLHQTHPGLYPDPNAQE
ncbi:MAG: four helix bundle protein, partial [Pirellulales bacterium]|nr:four helix bundle protein [Pirellulales bacterium]